MNSRVWTIAKKEFIQIWRDPWSLFIVIMLPVTMIFIYGYGVSFDVKNIITAVFDLDKSRQSRELVSSLEKSGYFEMDYYINDSNRIRELLDRGKINIAIWFPPDFSKNLNKGKTATIYTALDGSDSNRALISLSYVNQVVQTYSNKILVQRLPPTAKPLVEGFPPIEERTRVWYNPELISINYLVPGLIAIIMMMSAALLTSMTIVREKERGTIEQLMVSPLKSNELILGKLIPYIIISFLDIILTVLLSAFWFKVPIYGSIILFFILSTFFLITALGIGLFISVNSDSQSAAMLASLLLTMLPTFLLSGYAFPIENMPKIIQYLTHLIPARYYLVIVRGIFLKGVGIAYLWKDTLILIFFGLVVLSITARKFKNKLD